ncbi:alanine racemase [Synoicihabitans lomoniglobus]|uniref:Alanine racemase n=1 Tax=Synoicihabitans lomoniglobus TaxID=2909285 RepID=A0AAF0I400_9BACT|nr:alanine racemase [Opitutaceae bacterium LMO-M01]WED66464.1 alanine racemase [Opitutaceae bacterium LMO-M01]
MIPRAQLPLRCWAEIDLAALERNLRRIRAALPVHMRYVAVVKADAYGHGLHQVAARLMHAGADLFAVATLAEAAALRELGPGWPILLLSPLVPDEDEYIPRYDVAVTVSSLDEVHRFDRAGSHAKRPIDVHLKIDTGMGRSGVWHTAATAVYQAIHDAAHLRLVGIYTHYASPDDDPAFTSEQRQRFRRALASFGELDTTHLLIHADNSAGLETIERAGPFNAVRVGLLQFGISPRRGSLLDDVLPEPVFSFRTRVGLVKHLPAGTSISYGQTYRLTQDSRVAILTAGYGDGITRSLSNRGEVLIGGQRCRVLGRVTMDQTIVDVTHLEAVASGDEVVLIGRQGDAEIKVVEFSAWAESIPWETLCSVTKRVPRLYRTSLGI